MWLGGCDALFRISGRAHDIEEWESRGLPDPQIGAARFVFDDLQGLSTQSLERAALPWKLASTALVLAETPGRKPTPEVLRQVLQRRGLYMPDAIGNWPLPTQPDFDRPLGLITGPIRNGFPKVELEVATIGCASCHAGTLYDERGQPTLQAWLGTPNSSLDLQGYSDDIAHALQQLDADPSALLSQVRILHPSTTDAELETLRRFVWPKLRKRLAEAQAEGSELLPFRNAGPGRTNGVEALKWMLGIPLHAAGARASVSVPALHDRELRSSLLVDGLYVGKGQPRFVALARPDTIPARKQAEVTAFFTVPSMGIEPDRIPGAMPQVTQILLFLRQQGNAPRWPGRIDASLAASGAALYADKCAACHGTYAVHNGRLQLQSFPNVLVPADRIGTDHARLDAITDTTLRKIRTSTFNRYLDAARTGGYVAPPLSGVWASAPYLHNGSVPTLWHLLTPEQRPSQFQVGGHALDLVNVGIAGEDDGDRRWRYRRGYQPWSQPQWLDTRVPGNSNKGHAREVAGLSDSDKRALIEYMKQL